MINNMIRLIKNIIYEIRIRTIDKKQYEEDLIDFTCYLLYEMKIGETISVGTIMREDKTI